MTLGIAITFLLSALVAGLGKALRDTVDHHWHDSIFSKIKNPRVREWFRSDWKNRPSHPIAPLWDAWHFGDFISYISLVAPLVHYTGLHLIMVFIALFLATFSVLYHNLFLHKDKENLTNE